VAKLVKNVIELKGAAAKDSIVITAITRKIAAALPFIA
jgi:hypothetical protein